MEFCNRQKHWCTCSRKKRFEKLLTNLRSILLLSTIGLFLKLSQSRSGHIFQISGPNNNKKFMVDGKCRRNLRQYCWHFISLQLVTSILSENNDASDNEDIGFQFSWVVPTTQIFLLEIMFVGITQLARKHAAPSCSKTRIDLMWS